VFEPTGSRRDAASTIFNLSDYRVIDALEVPGHARRVEVEATSPPGCPVCGVISTPTTVSRPNRAPGTPHERAYAGTSPWPRSMTMNCSTQPWSPRSRAYYVYDRPAHCPANFEEPVMVSVGQIPWPSPGSFR